VRHIVSHVPGKFDSFTGAVTFDPKIIGHRLQLTADIDANSIDTGNEKRDNHLRSPDFFDVANNPKNNVQVQVGDGGRRDARRG
jgi:polyisoprenoid-binding protein YceI